MNPTKRTRAQSTRLLLKLVWKSFEGNLKPREERELKSLFEAYAKRAKLKKAK